MSGPKLAHAVAVVLLALSMGALALNVNAGTIEQIRESSADEPRLGLRTTLQPSDPPTILVTRGSTKLPAGCRPRDAALLVASFFTAFNHRDQARLSRVFRAPRGIRISQEFKWYSVYDTVDDYVAGDVRRLMAYFTRRQKHHERLRLRLLDIAGGPRGSGTAGFGFVLIRRADDFPAGLGGKAGIAEGKGEMNCRAQTIYVWSMSMEMAAGERFPHGLFQAPGPCPLPRHWDPVNGPIIACARSPRP
jgi:hypothetical protein